MKTPRPNMLETGTGLSLIYLLWSVRDFLPEYCKDEGRDVANFIWLRMFIMKISIDLKCKVLIEVGLWPNESFDYMFFYSHLGLCCNMAYLG